MRVSQTATTIRLLLGYTAVFLAASVFLLDYKYGWDATKSFTLYACIAYFVLNGLLTAWVWLGEAGLVFDGSRGDGRLRLWVKPSGGKYSPAFGVKWVWNGEAGEAKGTYMQWFDEKGFLSEEALKEWLVSNVPVLKRLEGDVTGEEQDAVVESVDGGVGEGEARSPGSGSGRGTKKGRKKG